MRHLLQYNQIIYAKVQKGSQKENAKVTDFNESNDFWL